MYRELDEETTIRQTQVSIDVIVFISSLFKVSQSTISYPIIYHTHTEANLVREMHWVKYRIIITIFKIIIAAMLPYVLFYACIS